MPEHVDSYSDLSGRAGDMAAAGVRCHSRYLSHTPAKNLTVPEVRRLQAAGIDVMLNFEDSGHEPLRGWDQGKADAVFANTLADQLGAPLRAAIYYSTDQSVADPNQVRQYYQGAGAAGGRPVGIYGGANIVDALLLDGTCRVGWNSNASSWDFGQPIRAHLHQLYGHPHGVMPGFDPASYDESVVLQAPFGTWGPNSSGEDVGYAQWGPLEKIALMKDVRNTVVEVLRGAGFLTGAPNDAPALNLEGLIKDNLGDPTAPRPSKLNDIHGIIGALQAEVKSLTPGQPIDWNALLQKVGEKLSA